MSPNRRPFDEKTEKELRNRRTSRRRQKSTIVFSGVSGRVPDQTLSEKSTHYPSRWENKDRVSPTISVSLERLSSQITGGVKRSGRQETRTVKNSLSCTRRHYPSQVVSQTRVTSSHLYEGGSRLKGIHKRTQSH